jgi:hypothetical protein
VPGKGIMADFVAMHETALRRCLLRVEVDDPLADSEGALYLPTSRRSRRARSGGTSPRSNSS